MKEREKYSKMKKFLMVQYLQSAHPLYTLNHL